MPPVWVAGAMLGVPGQLIEGNENVHLEEAQPLCTGRNLKGWSALFAISAPQHPELFPTDASLACS